MDALYQEIILDHNRNPRNFGEMPNATGVAHGLNPMCGDEVTMYVNVRDARITGVTFTGQGCAISKASASMLTQSAQGLTPDEARALFDAFHNMVTGKSGAKDTKLGKLAAFAGVARFPMRVKCASLAWHAFRDALAASEGVR